MASAAGYPRAPHMTSASGPNREGQRQAGAPGKRRRRRPRKDKPRTPSPVERVERAAASEALTAPVDTETPLTPAEVAEFRRRFAFLRDYKKTLKLKLNAQEDLLLEGARDPDSRGVCHHLLSKVDYATVQRAVERMPNADRPHLLGGVLDFRPELSFLLLYLESLQAAGHGDASRALEGALESIDWKSVSEGQMRRVLDLIVELFDQNRRASLLLGLLESRSFQQAFDQSISKLPPALAELFVPVRALQAVVLEGKPNPADDGALADGLAFALKSGLSQFEKRSARVRARLLDALARHAPERLDENFGTALKLLATFDPGSRERHTLELAIARGLLALGREDRARKRVRELLRQTPNDPEAGALDRALSAPRVGPYALLRGGATPPVEHLNEGLMLQGERPVWLRVAALSERPQLEQHARDHARLWLPGVARLLACDATRERSFVALERRGDPLVPGHARLRTRAEALDAAFQITTHARALARLGLELPDLAPRRFEVVAHGSEPFTLRLVNTWQLREAEQAEQNLLAASRRLPLLGRHLNRSETERLDACEDFESLLATLDALRWGPLG